jgi:ATP-dependent Zn protease
MKSCILDFKAIETMFKILFELKISFDEIKEFKFFLRNYIRNINLIFEVESKLNEKNKIKEKNLKIVSYIFYIFSFIIILIMNWIFLKNKKNQNKKFFNTNKGINMRKYQIYKKNLDKIKENEQINQPRSYDSFSKEEQGYIDKLLNYQNNSY